jgi:hypothetical protein
MHRVFSILVLSGVLTGCQSLAPQKPPCSCGHQHTSVQQHNRTIATTVSTQDQPAGIAPVADTSSHGCSDRHCEQSAVHVVQAQFAETPAQVEPTLAVSNCKRCGNNKTSHVQYPTAQPAIVQTPPSLATHVVRSRPTLTVPAPGAANQFLQLRPAPEMSAARIHTVATNEPMVSLPGMRHDQYLALVSHQANVSAGQSEWHSR